MALNNIFKDFMSLTIWERYFLREMLKVFLLFLFGFYGLYVLIDYSTHSNSFHHHHFRLVDILRFYGYEFITRMDMLLPFSILIATIKTLCMLNVHNELVALMASGIKLKRLMRPFLYFGLFFTCVVYINSEMLNPFAMKDRKRLEQARAQKKQKKYQQQPIQQVVLEDETTIIFQHYDHVDESFYDAYWIRSIDDIYRIKYLYPYHDEPIGHSVEHLQRNDAGKLLIAESFKQKAFPDMNFNKKRLMETVTLPDELSLTALKEKIPQDRSLHSEKEAQLLTTYYYKLGFPWVCLLAVIGPAPFCTRFSRTLPQFFIYALSLFGLFAFYLVIDAAVILGERQVMSPLAAIGIPFAGAFAFFGWRFIRL